MAKIKGKVVTEENCLQVVKEVVRSMRELNRSPRMRTPLLTREDMISEAWLEIRQNRMGKPIGSAISYTRAHLRRKYRRSFDKYAPENRSTDVEATFQVNGEDHRTFEEHLGLDLYTEQQIDLIDLKEQVAQAIDSIVERKYVVPVARMYFLDLRSTQEIARENNLPLPTVQTYVTWARSEIAWRLKRKGFRTP